MNKFEVHCPTGTTLCNPESQFVDFMDNLMWIHWCKKDKRIYNIKTQTNCPWEWIAAWLYYKKDIILYVANCRICYDHVKRNLHCRIQNQTTKIRRINVNSNIDEYFKCFSEIVEPVNNDMIFLNRIDMSSILKDLPNSLTELGFTTIESCYCENTPYFKVYKRKHSTSLSYIIKFKAETFGKKSKFNDDIMHIGRDAIFRMFTNICRKEIIFFNLIIPRFSLYDLYPIQEYLNVNSYIPCLILDIKIDVKYTN